MDANVKATASRLIHEAIATREVRNNLIRGKFGDRITLALSAECEQRDREIEAYAATLELLEAQ